MKGAYEKGTSGSVALASMETPQPKAVLEWLGVDTSGGAPTKDDVEQAKKTAEMVSWAAKTLRAKGAPQAADMEARAARKIQQYEALRTLLEKVEKAPAVAAVLSTPVVAASPAPVISGDTPSEEEVQKLKKEVDLLVWAVKALKAQGAPQAAAMEAKAATKTQQYEALKTAFEKGVAAAPYVAPVAAARPAAPAASISFSGQKPTQEELSKLKQAADLLVWAADNLEAQGAPQAPQMRAKANKKIESYKAMLAATA